MATAAANSFNMRPVTPPHDESLLRNDVGLKNQNLNLSGVAHGVDRTSNDPTTLVSTHLQSLIYWERPARSMVALTVSLLFIYMTRQYSLLQIGAAAMTVATGLNLAYVFTSMSAQRIFSDNNEPALHPHRQRINNPDPLISKNHIHHYVDLFTEIMETIGKEVKKIVLVEDKSRSLTWFAISFVVWTFAAHISSRVLVVISLLASFTLPRFYQSNKHVVDARIAQTNSMLSGQLHNAQNLAVQSANDAYAKARTLAARTGTTGTDAKNTLNRASVVSKED
ncbi:Reticulon-domain-containing protein [Umbelopsis sp. AD052]|nr:Reticulon-domain-containing protein [Umbelopsis sp. AD052]